MDSNTGVYVGIYLSQDYSMVSFLDMTTKEPHNILFSDKRTSQDNPLPLSEWSEANKQGDIAAVDTITNYIGTLIEYAKKLAKTSSIVKICLVVENFSMDTLDVLALVMSKLQYTKEQWCVISEEESFAYYAYNQKKELYASGVLLVDYRHDGLHAYLMRNGKSMNKEFIMENSYSLCSENIVAACGKEQGLESVAKEIIDWLSKPLSEHIISSVYLTGKGFDVPDFPENLTKFFCNRRKVFAGQNLYVKGACYGAYEETAANRGDDIILACSNRVTTGIELDILERGVNRRLRVVKAGTNWYMARRKLDFILEDMNVLKLILKPCDTNKEYCEEIDISSIPYRKGKMTRIELDIYFNSDSRFTVTVKDKGFGDFVKSSKKIVSKDIEL